MSFGASPFGSDGPESKGRRDDSVSDVAPTGLLGRLKRHVRTWPERYVRMRIDARED